MPNQTDEGWHLTIALKNNKLVDGFLAHHRNLTGFISEIRNYLFTNRLNCKVVFIGVTTDNDMNVKRSTCT